MLARGIFTLKNVVLDEVYLQSDAIIPSRRLVSTIRVASSMMPRSPFELVCPNLTPESKVVLADLARLQLSALAASTFSCSAFFLMAASSSIFFLAISRSLSLLASGFAVVAAVFGAVADVAASALDSVLGFSLTSVVCDVVALPGCCKTRFAGILAGGGWSLKTLRPEASSHIYCAIADVVKTRPKMAIKCGKVDRMIFMA
jgi:hypothetical protein